MSEMSFFSDGDWDHLADDLALSLRQKQVIVCLFSGQSDKQIAECVGISVPTVRTHFSRIFAKLGVQDRVELILYVMQQCKVSYGHS